MAEICRIIGGPGTGKTERLLRIMDKILQTDVQSPEQIGFVSLTRAARQEAAERAAARYQVDPANLLEYGWFRTLHSVCYKVLKVGNELLVGDKKSTAWIVDAIGEDIETAINETAFAEGQSLFTQATSAGIALTLWDTARNKLLPYQDVHAAASMAVDAVPEYGYCRSIVEKYETAKDRDARCDFVDLLARVAGVRLTLDGAEQSYPEGSLPWLPVWFCDEAQDLTPLAWRVWDRLISGARWAYTAGDPFQALFCFSGAVPEVFLKQHVNKQDVLEESHRCPQNLINLGEDCIRKNSDWFDRKIRSSKPPAQIDEMYQNDPLRDVVDPHADWLLLARTNYHAEQLAGRCQRIGWPWRRADGKNSSYAAPVKIDAITGLRRLAAGKDIDGQTWANIIKLVPSKRNDVEYLIRGTKTEWEKPDADKGTRRIVWGSLPAVGATREFQELVINGAWVSLLENAKYIYEAMEEHGESLVQRPMVRVGTIHSAKGLEAENVLLSTEITRKVQRSMQTTEGRESEGCVFYVGATRAKSRLVLYRPAANVPVYELI